MDPKKMTPCGNAIIRGNIGRKSDCKRLDITNGIAQNLIHDDKRAGRQFYKFLRNSGAMRN